MRNEWPGNALGIPTAGAAAALAAAASAAAVLLLMNTTWMAESALYT